MKSSAIDKIAKKIKTPKQMQSFVKGLKYNEARTLNSANEVLKKQTAHCLEAAFLTAAVLEIHNYPPLIVSFESQDGLDHVVFVFRQRNLWGAVAQSRDEGLYGRAPVFRTLKDLAWSYFDPYIDATGKLTGYQVVHLDESKADWRYSKKNLWQVENYLLEVKHEKLNSSKRRYQKLKSAFEKKSPLKESPTWW